MSQRTRGNEGNDGDASPFVAGGGEMGKLIRSLDWSRTPLGPIETWPQSLRTTVSLCLSSTFPISIAWGPGHVQIYNDGYWPICGSKHPSSMGQDYTECWASAWPVIGGAFSRALAGEPAFLENQRMFLDRKGFLEETFFTFSFSPILDESGNVGGLFHPVTEVTPKLLSERRTAALRDVAVRGGEANTAEEVYRFAAETLSAYAPDLPFVLVYVLDEAAGRARLAAGYGLEACPAARRPDLDLADASTWPLAEVARSADPAQVDALDQRFGPMVAGPYPEPPTTAVLLSITPLGSERPAVLVAGVSARLALDEPYRAFLGLLAGACTTAVANANAYEAERRRAEALAAIDRAKTTFFSNVSHEFRTPLTLLLGPAEDLLASELTAPQREQVELVHGNALRLEKLVNALLDFTRTESGRTDVSYEPTDLAEVTRDLASTFRAATEKAGLTLTVVCPALDEPVYVDRDLWEKVVFNLLSNALKFTFDGGITVALDEAGTDVALTVRDTGVGIPDTEMPRLFERFHRVEGVRARSHEGSGIGLALVQELAKLHGGSVRAESALGVGTTFTVRIPKGTSHLPQDRIAATRSLPSTAQRPTSFLAEARAWLSPRDRRAEQDALAVRGPGPTARILFADDNADMRSYILRILEPHWEVEAVDDGTQALEAALARPPDLLLTDVMMPGLDGFALVRELRKHESTRAIPVVMLSARAGEASRSEAIAAGVEDYLVKPFSSRELVARIEAQLLRSRLRSLEREHALRMAAVFAQAPIAIAVLRGPTLVFELANPHYRDLVGGRPVAGLPIRAALPELAGQGMYELLDEVFRSGEPFVGTSVRLLLERQGQPDEGFFNFVYQPMKDLDGRVDGIVVVGVEVTELARARREAESANRSKDEFLAMLGHELRNPLAPILTALHLLRLQGDERSARTRAVLERQVAHLVALVDDLLDISRITEGKLQLKRVVLP
nr:response regulator [Deltaproteobacteria bacterium]